jgi:hypothetical protein
MYLSFLVIEFFLNRILNRFWIFVPATPATHALFVGIQWAGLVSMLALYVYSFLLLGHWGRRALPLTAAAFALTAMDLASYVGIYVKLLWILPLLFSLFFRDKLNLAFGVYYAVRGFAYLALGGLGPYAWLFDLAWALLPLLGGFAVGRRAVLAAAAALAAVAASPYYMGMVLIFGLGLTVPLFFPLAVFTALSSKSRYSLFPLLVGPQVQLSVHYLVLAVGMGYVVRGELERRALRG